MKRKPKTRDGFDDLLERLPASKVARLLAAWRVGQGDYLAARGKLFAGETVDSLYEKAKGMNGSK